MLKNLLLFVSGWLKINIEYFTEEHLLEKAYENDAAYDIKAFIKENVILKPNEIKVVSTGIRFNLPKGIEAQVRPRSGLAANYGVTVLNSPGTIDSGYKGIVQVILINHGKENYSIQNGNKIAQIVFSKILNTKMKEISQIDVNLGERKEKGFGSSGK